jgi:hypothetical protein
MIPGGRSTFAPDTTLWEIAINPHDADVYGIIFSAFNFNNLLGINLPEYA